MLMQAHFPLSISRWISSTLRPVYYYHFYSSHVYIMSVFSYLGPGLDTSAPVTRRRDSGQEYWALVDRAFLYIIDDCSWLFVSSVLFCFLIALMGSGRSWG